MNEIIHASEEELQGLVDGRLAAKQRAAVAAHLEACSACRAEHESLVCVKNLIVKSHRAFELPADLEQSVRDALDREDRQRLASRWRVAVTLAASLLTVAFGLTWWLGRTGNDLPTIVSRDYSNVRSGKLQLDVVGTSAAEVEALFRREGVHFRTRVFDLAMMGYRLRGGHVHRLAGRPSALLVYEGANGEVLLCQMYPGRLSDLARPVEIDSRRGFDFYIYHRGSVTLVFWQEGDVVCVLAGDFDSQAIVNLAFQKAML